MAALHRPALLLELDLTMAPLEVEPDDVVGKLRTRHRPRLRAVLRTLHEAGDDKRVRGLIVKLGGGLEWAVMQELRAGVQAFARSGKPVVAWAETFAEGGNGTADYVLATAAAEIWLQPSGELGLLGVAYEATFLRGALDKLGVEPQLEQRYEYKNAADVFTRTEFTPAHREAAERAVVSIWDAAVADVAAGRGLDAGVVRGSADRAPLSASEARDAGLVDRLGYRDEVYADVRARVGDQTRLLFADQWTPRPKAATLVRRHRDHVALVEVHGTIAVGRSRSGPGSTRAGSGTVSAALRAARKDEHVKSVLLRIDSPGGSAVASDTIWREVCLVRAAGKPVVVSMASLAASGGYYIACPADVIVAQPATLTGSIGVLGGKLVVSELLGKLGLGTGAVAHGERARMFSARRGFDEGEQAKLADMLDRVYADFVQKVADGRRMSYDDVHAVARGRVWSGADASANGLVDTLGGLREAARIARERAGLRTDAPVRPARHVPPLQRLRRPRSSDDPRAAAGVSAWGDLGGLAAALGLPAAGPLLMPAVRLR
ncbi:MAG TPA: signal peptide peptidase SppA [Jatrophihabitans sp.]|nr:signal peptide peptidase SppA [Jatrophihabitans sp.]